MKTRKRLITLGMMALLLLTLIGAAFYHDQASAGPVVIGHPEGASLEALVKDNGTTLTRIVYFKTGAKTMANTTPVVSQAICGQFGSLNSAQVALVGTMSGTNPTLTVLWRNSKDGGVTWTNVGTWTAINATTTPALQDQTVSDVVGSTAVAYGDCWDATYQFGGTGTVTANISILGINK